MLRNILPLFGLLIVSNAFAAPLPEPLSYAKPCPGDRFVLVVFGSPEAEAKLGSGDIKRQVESVRAKYPVQGMYEAGDGAKLVYSLGGYAPDTNIYLTADGRYVIRVEGDWWKTTAYPAGKRLSAEAEQLQLDAPAVSFFRDGALLKSYPLKVLVTDPLLLPNSPDHILWASGATLQENSGRFLLDMQDRNRNTFDYRTGELLSTEKLGYENKFGQKLILATVGLTFLLFLGWAFYAFRRPRTVPIAGQPLT